MLQLFPINKCVISKNKQKLDALPGEIIRIPALGLENKKNAKQITELKKLGLDIIETKIGAEMMIRKNLDIEKKLVNGRIGTLHSISKNAAGEISTLNLEIEGVIHPISRYTYSKPEVDENGKEKKSTVLLEQFPLTLAYAFTFHKSQGMTISTPTYINFMNCREPHSHYVAIGRVTELENLYLDNFDPKKITIHPEVEKIFSEREKYFVA
jgi:ATP-dependent DNA helicase PIF1